MILCNCGFATRNTTVTVDRDLTLSDYLVLHSGTLAMGSKAKLLKTPIVYVGSRGELTPGSAMFETDAVAFDGNTKRSAGIFWPAAETMAAATTAANTDVGKRDIFIQQRVHVS